jgi:hypothetical protein
VLSKQVEQAQKDGFGALCASELEYFIYNDTYETVRSAFLLLHLFVILDICASSFLLLPSHVFDSPSSRLSRRATRTFRPPAGTARTTTSFR